MDMTIFFTSQRIAGRRRLRQAMLVAGWFWLATVLVSAQVNVSVDLSKPINVLTDSAVGFPAMMYDGNAFNPAAAPYFRTAGISAPRFPGNHPLADLYHWTSSSLAPYKGFDKPYTSPDSSFGNFAKVAEKLGSAVIVVNYGTNEAGTGPAEPAEAAAWVAYANGDPKDPRTLGKDSTGKDWQTVGFWATLRGDPPFAGDDGLNTLRMNHPKPFGFKIWQVGDQIFNNGYLGGEHVGNPDLHGPAPTATKDYAKLKKNPALSPEAFAANLKAFATAMKAVDPTIQVGAALITPPTGGQTAPEWNRPVLKGACGSLDFVSLDWTSGGLLAPDYKTLDESTLFQYSRNDVATIVRTMLDDDKLDCPAGHTPRLALSNASPQMWPMVEHPIVRALWAADINAILIESGFLNADWPEGFGNTMMSPDLKKFGPVFYGLQMLHIVAHTPGDAMMAARSSSETLSVHVTRRRDGIVGIMLVNTDPKSVATVKISLKGNTVGVTGKRFDYGASQLAQAAAPVATPLTVTGNDFSITVPAYSITDLLLPLAAK
jgi:hypothetical protein